MIRVKLTPAKMAPLKSITDLENFAAAVSRYFDDKTGLDVEIDVSLFYPSPEDDEIEGATFDEDREIRKVLCELWEEWCEDEYLHTVRRACRN